MNGQEDLLIRESRVITVQKRRTYVSDELQKIAVQKDWLDSRGGGRYYQEPAVPAPSGFIPPAVNRAPGVGGLVKKRPAPSPLQKAQVLAEQPVATGYGVDKRPRVADLEKEKRIQSIFSQCLTIVKQLSKLKDASPFLKPVDPIALKCPDYLSIIKNPMDFGTIQKRLEHKPEKGIVRQYKDPQEFVADMRLIFENCRVYNAPGHAVRKMGDSISEVWEKKWKTSGIAEKWEQELKRLDGEEFYDDGKSNLPQQIHRYTAELHSVLDTMRTCGQKQPPGDRPMTFEEKRKLSIAIGRLPGDSLYRVLQIVGEDPKYAHVPFDADEVELDIDELSQATHWRLDNYVNGVFEQPQPTKTAGTGGVSSHGLMDHRADQEDTSRHHEAVRHDPAEGLANRPLNSGQSSSSGDSGTSSDSGSGGEVGSKQINGSHHEAGQKSEVAKRTLNHEGGGAGTFFSATAPAKSQIIRGQSKYKKSENPIDQNAWASLLDTPANPGGQAEEDDAGPRGEDENLWLDFQSREEQEAQRAQEQKAEEDRIRAARAAKEEEARKEAEAARRKDEEEEAERKRKADEEAEQRRIETELQRSKELEAGKNANSGYDVFHSAELREQFKHGPDTTDDALQAMGLKRRLPPEEDFDENSEADEVSEDGEMA
eukprot:jgi/Botrbrau1/18012/Bobra.0062s0005.1